jgi:hypothetical protein
MKKNKKGTQDGPRENSISEEIKKKVMGPRWDNDRGENESNRASLTQVT